MRRLIGVIGLLLAACAGGGAEAGCVTTADCAKGLVCCPKGGAIPLGTPGTVCRFPDASTNACPEAL